MKTITLDPCVAVETTCGRLEVGNIVWFSETMIALDAKRKGAWEVVRIWRWDNTSNQIRLKSCDGTGRMLSECASRDLKFFKLPGNT